MRISFTLSYLVLLCLCVGGCSGKKIGDAAIYDFPVLYQIYMGTSADDFDSKSSAVAGGGGAGGAVIVWVNGEPLTYYDEGGMITPINLLLRPGQNNVWLTGEHHNPIYAKVVR